jgi:hypothetical protein
MGTHTDEGRAAYEAAMAEFNGAPVAAPEPLEVIVVETEITEAHRLAASLFGDIEATEQEFVEMLKMAYKGDFITHPRLHDEVESFLFEMMFNEPTLVTFEQAPEWIENEIEIAEVQASINAKYDYLEEMGSIEGQEFVTPIIINLSAYDEHCGLDYRVVSVFEIQANSPIVAGLDDGWTFHGRDENEAEYDLSPVLRKYKMTKLEKAINAHYAEEETVKENTIKCPHCGASVPESTFCDQCGTAIKAKVEPEPTIVEKVSAIYQAANAKAKKANIFDGMVPDDKGYYHAGKGHSWVLTATRWISEAVDVGVVFAIDSIRAIKSYEDAGWRISYANAEAAVINS